ncbi:MAG: glutathione S-transferase [Aliishimia sp.]
MSRTDMILHHVPASRSFRVLWLMEELGLEATIKSYSIRDGSMRAPEYLAKNPLGRAPALEWNGQVVTESGAILQLLAEQNTQAGLDRAVGHDDRARYLELFAFAETMASQIEALNMQHLFLRDPEMQSVTVMKLNTARLRSAMKALEHWLGEQEYMLPSGLSAVDMMMGFNVVGAPFYVKLDEFPRLTAYRARIKARDAFQRAQAKDGVQDFYDQDFYPLPEGRK